MPDYGQWIKCSDRLPEENEYVIATDGENVGEMIFKICRYSEQTIEDMQWRKKQRSYFEDDEGRSFDNPIVYWMPLPKPPNA